MAKLLKLSAIPLILLGSFFLVVSLYGLTQDIRPASFPNHDLRFPNDTPIPYEQAVEQIKRLDAEPEADYLDRLTKVIAKSLAHINWETLDNSEYNMHIPIWENYILYLMGVVTGIPEYEKYHYSNHYRSLERGIGICGDASMVMSQILDKNGIPNQLLSFPGHVVVVAETEQGERVFDPDFGVSLPFTPEDLKYHENLVGDLYIKGGYTNQDGEIMGSIYTNGFERWNGVSHFITKKYYFEKLAYGLKWPLPIISIMLGIFFFVRFKDTQKSAQAYDSKEALGSN